MPWAARVQNFIGIDQVTTELHPFKSLVAAKLVILVKFKVIFFSTPHKTRDIASMPEKLYFLDRQLLTWHEKKKTNKNLIFFSCRKKMLKKKVFGKFGKNRSFKFSKNFFFQIKFSRWKKYYFFIKTFFSCSPSKIVPRKRFLQLSEQHFRVSCNFEKKMLHFLYLLD